MAKETKDHRHCIMCGKVISPDEYFCSEECEKKFREHQKQVGKRRTITMVLFIAIFTAFVIIAIIGTTL